MEVLVKHRIISSLQMIFICVSCLVLTSCDCVQISKGIVLDKETKLPIDSVFVQNAIKKQNHDFSDTAGRFEVHSISGGFRSCPIMTISMSKPGYEILTIEYDEIDTVYLEKIW